NNIAVLHAYQGQIEQAEYYAAKARSASEDKNDIANIATKGLILFRAGSVDEACIEYEKAMGLAIAARRVDLYLRAYAFLGREICRIDNGMQSLVAEGIDKASKVLEKRNMRLPREIALMREEFRADAQASEELNQNFASLVESKVEHILVI
ncbi:MAG: hypothetical protein KBT70_13360, partial [Roseovarius sp.]|uniref:hypothetical protein n=1 Tax=Roseovarius sp. TaxID=1486281 RepID=UPI001B70CA54